MLNSICIKTNRKKVIAYLLKAFETFPMESVSLSHREFKLYHNIILHYSGDNVEFFHYHICDILVDTILSCYEKSKLKQYIELNYFYFSEEEKEIILDHCLSYLNTSENIDSLNRKDDIYIALLKYISENKSIVLDGFINFRLSNYMKLLDSTIDLCVNDFIIEREYNEFVHLLQAYISSKEPSLDLVHLIYLEEDSLLIDSKKNIIPIDRNCFGAKYLSDITFSSNDFILNTLLTILPQKIILHLIDEENEFTHTIQSIFENRVTLCKDCSICNTYKLLHHVNPQKI